MSSRGECNHDIPFLCPPPPSTLLALSVLVCTETDGCSSARIIKHQSTRNNAHAVCMWRSLPHLGSLPRAPCARRRNPGQLDWLQGAAVRLRSDQLFHRCGTIRPEKDYFGDCVNLSVFCVTLHSARSYHVSLSGD